MKILNKKKNQDYTKKVYIDISEPEAQSFISFEKSQHVGYCVQ